jgi:2'-hydroxyisoflavone reductase
MKVLILGGTVFLGRHLVEAALARGHTVTIFTRGRSNPDLFPAVERLRGDRDGDLTALAGRRWDAVVDTSGHLPREVRASARLLAGAAGHYTFVSSISVYAPPLRPGADEAAPVGALPDGSAEEVTDATFGPLKAACERAAEMEAQGRTLIVRPGLLVGPHDPTDRFTYWPRRAARGGDILAPDRPDRPAQLIDARDLAAWIVRQIEGGQVGVFNATGPAAPLMLGDLLAECRRVAAADSRVVWVDEPFLLDAGVAPWSELPLWLPVGRSPELAGLMAVSIEKALAAGLTCRPLAETIRDTLAWDAARPADEPRRAGLAPEREAAVLKAWRARSRPAGAEA